MFRFAPVWAFLFILLVVVGCSKKDAPVDEATTVAQDKENIDNTFKQALGCVSTMKNGDFVQSAFQFMKLQSGEILNEEWITDMANSLDEVLDVRSGVENGRFDLAALKGTYTWSQTTQSWTKSSVSGNQVVVLFPESRTATTNGYELRVSEYTDAKYVIQGDNIYLPTVAKASLKKNNVELMSINWNAQYTSSGFPAPVSSRLTVLAAPFTISLDIARVDDKTFQVKFDLDNGSCGKTSLQTKFFFNHNDYENYFDGSSETADLDKMELKFAKSDLAVDVNFDVKKFNTFDDPTTTQVNSCAKATLSYKGFKIGDLQLKDVQGETELHIVYKDGTSENVSKYYEPFIEDVKQVLRPQLDL